MAQLLVLQFSPVQPPGSLATWHVHVHTQAASELGFVVVVKIPSSICTATLPSVLATLIVATNSFLYPRFLCHSCSSALGQARKWKSMTKVTVSTEILITFAPLVAQFPSLASRSGLYLPSSIPHKRETRRHQIDYCRQNNLRPLPRPLTRLVRALLRTIEHISMGGPSLRDMPLAIAGSRRRATVCQPMSITFLHLASTHTP